MIKFKLIVLLLCASIFSLKAESQLILLPLPFYAQSSGWGVAVKGIHPNIGNNLYLDFAGYGTEKSRYGLFTTVGQKNIPWAPWLFWNIKINGSKQERDYFGQGNDLENSTESTFRYMSYGHSERLGVQFGPWIKLHALHLYSHEEISDFSDPESDFPLFWENEVPIKKYHFYAIGGGIEIGKFNSDIRPLEGTKIKYEYYDSYSGDINIQHHLATAAKLLPLTDWWSHGVHLYYEAFSGQTPFIKNPDIWVRGIAGQRHNGQSSIALHNESRLYFGNDFMLTPFYDIGRVYFASDSDRLQSLHQGFGLGLRYIYRQALVLRLDYGVSAYGESDIIFNYQHTF